MKQTVNKGITLIALVITIIVMLILVGVTINLSLNGGLFGYAKQAVKETENARDQELDLANGAIIDYYLNVDSDVQALPKYADAKKENGILTENAQYVEGTNVAVIPKGFKVSDKKDEQSIANGLVIQDEEGNEFVWIPVTDGELNRTDWEENEPTGTISEEYTETLPEEIVASVKQCKGFYIGRYEAGSTTARTSSSGTTTMVVQKGAYPYNYVGWSDETNNYGAVWLSENMYLDSNTYGVKSVLTYGAMWDETLKFIRDKVNVTNSTSWGNYGDSTFTFSGKYLSATWSEIVTNETKPTSKNWLLTTGASETNKAKNIYDLAGNVCE